MHIMIKAKMVWNEKGLGIFTMFLVHVYMYIYTCLKLASGRVKMYMYAVNYASFLFLIKLHFGWKQERENSIVACQTHPAFVK